MLPCAPYIKNICQAVQLRNEEGFSPEQSPKHNVVKKKQTEVKVTDVSSVKVDLLDTSGEVVSYSGDKNIKVIAADVTKVLTTFKPESPDVTRAAKKFEKDQQIAICVDKSAKGFVKSCEAEDESEEQCAQENLGAISKSNKR